MILVPDIITTIESAARDHVARFKAKPPKTEPPLVVVYLSDYEFEAYEKEIEAGREPAVMYDGKKIFLSIRRILEYEDRN